MAKKAKNPHSLSNDMKEFIIPLDLFSAFSVILDEVVTAKEFVYNGFVIENTRPILTFKKKTHRVEITINKNDFTVKEYKPKNGEVKLAVLHVVKPTSRTFKLR